MSKDNYSDSDVVKSPWMKWNKVGDKIYGTLTSVSEREQTNQNTGKSETVKVYEMLTDGGEFHDVDDEKNVIKEAVEIKEGEMWNIGGHFTFDPSMKNIRIGQRLKIEFTETKPSKTKGYAPMKIRKVFSQGKMNEEYLDELAEERKQKEIENF